MKIQAIKKASTLTGLVVILVLVMGVFIGCFNYLEWNVNEAGESLDPKYSTPGTNFTNQAVDADGNKVGIMYKLDTNVKDVQAAFANVTEATSIYSVAWNGLKGLGYVLKLPISFVTTGVETFSVLIYPLSEFPSWVLILVGIGITGFIVLLVLSILKGDPRL